MEAKTIKRSIEIKTMPNKKHKEVYKELDKYFKSSFNDFILDYKF